MITVRNLTKIYKTPKNAKGSLRFFKNLLKREYKQTTAVNTISFEIQKGELIGFIGPNGAGKTTTMKILSGILYPTSGTVDVLGYTPWEKKPAFLKQIAFLMGQRNQLLWDLPATDSFLLNKEIYEVEDGKFEKNVRELVGLLDCEELTHQPVRTLSLGERMKMELIASLLYEPKVLFLDEPTIGLDVVAQKTIRDFIKEYQRRTHATIILTSHYMEDVKQLAKRVIIINHGKIIYDGRLDEVIRRYVKEKIITVILEEEPKKELLEKLSSDYQLQFPRLTARIKREDLNEKVELISKHLVFHDITIEEERIEDVIRKIFQKAPESILVTGPATTFPPVSARSDSVSDCAPPGTLPVVSPVTVVEKCDIEDS